ERILIGAEAIGIGRVALARAARYAKERVVFGRPIGQNQAIQHPLAESWMELEAANLMMLKAAQLYDSGAPCGVEANAAKYLGAEAGFNACTRAVMTHGGYGYAKEFHVERYLREVMIARLVPVSRELILCYVAERALDLPKSYSAHPTEDDPMAVMSGKRAFLELLRQEGVGVIFGNPGTTELPLIDALAVEPEPRYVLALQEGAVLAMAGGYAQAS